MTTMLFLIAIFLTAGMLLAGLPETAGVLIFGLTLIGAASLLRRFIGKDDAEGSNNGK